MHICFLGSQAVPVGQAPQSLEPSHPSPMVPQYCPPANVQETLVQLGLPQIPATLALQTVPAEQAVLQVIEPPHPSPITPQ
jgi:hypothetical protein